VTIEELFDDMCETAGLHPMRWQRDLLITYLNDRVTVRPGPPEQTAKCVCEHLLPHSHIVDPPWVPAFDRILVMRTIDDF